MKKLVAYSLLAALLVSPSVVRAMDWKDLIAVWLITKCVVYVCCEKSSYCCSCAKRKKMTVDELKMVVRILQEELALHTLKKNAVRIKLV